VLSRASRGARARRAAGGLLVSRRYLAALAVAACVVLGIGLLVRNVLLRDSTPAPAAPPSQAAVLQQLSREGQLRRMSAYVAERVAAAAEFVTYVPSADAAGVRWAGDTVVTTGAERTVVAVPVPAGDTLRGTATLATDSVRRDWVLVVGRRADGQIVSTAGLAGGRVTSQCAGHDVEEYVLGAPLSDALAGAGLFNLEGEVLGLVVRCGSRLVALPAPDVTRLLAGGSGPADALGTRFGLAIAPPVGSTRAYVGSDSGLLVTVVRRGGPADAAGLRVGDVIVAVNGRAVGGVADARALSAGAPADTHTVTRRRGRATATVRLTASPPGSAAPAADGGAGSFGIDVAPPPARGVAITAVRPGSIADLAGLQPGDRLLRLGGTPVTSAAEAERLLAAAAAAASPALVVFERDSVERGALLPPRPRAAAGGRS